MGSTAASATFHAYGQLIRTPSIHPLIKSPSVHPNLSEKKSNREKEDRGTSCSKQCSIRKKYHYSCCVRDTNMIDCILNNCLKSFASTHLKILYNVQRLTRIQFFLIRKHLLHFFKMFLFILVEFFFSFMFNHFFMTTYNQLCFYAVAPEYRKNFKIYFSYMIKLSMNLYQCVRDLYIILVKWSFAAAVLYALTVITSTEKEKKVVKVTIMLLPPPTPTIYLIFKEKNIYKIQSVISFIVRSYAKLLQFWHFIASIVEMIRTNLFDGDVDSIDSLQLKKKRRESDEENSEDDDDRLQLPIASYFALIIGYCCIGSLLFNTFEKGPIW
uniref:Uncharacterized protein n=1 Tax=Heterorhabditis bacteriophora TaxID=37862 RepID=A0A1I7WLK7_HETBA